MAKATKRQMIEREEDIQRCLKQGNDIHDFADDLAKKHKCSRSSIVRQYRNIIKEMAESQKEERDELRVKLMMRNDLLYKKALEAGNIKNAIDAVNLQAKIGGLYRPEPPKEEDKPKTPVFNFTERDTQLTVVPEDDDERDTGSK